MSESESDLMVAEDRPMTPLQIFFAKVAIVTIAILVILYGIGYFVTSYIESQTEAIKILKGGPAFWSLMETKLYRMADEPDLPPEKKKKIIDALRKLSTKYRPYFEAVAGENSPGETKK
jgi:hypothetical protein